MALWPFKKRSKTNSGEKRPALLQTTTTTTAPILIPRSELQPSPPKKQHISSNRITQEEWTRRSGSIKQPKSDAGLLEPSLDSFPIPPSKTRLISTPPQVEIRNVFSQSQQTDPPVLVRSDSSTSPPPPPPRTHKRNVLRRRSSRKDFDARTEYLRENASNQAGPSTSAPSRSVPFFSRSMSVQSFRNRPDTLERDENQLIKPSSRRHSERPTSDNLPPRDSAQSSASSHSSLRAFKVRSLDVLSPRPRLFFAENVPSSAAQKYGSYDFGEMRGGYEWRRALRAPITEEPQSMKRNRVYGLADDLDSRGIRDALERDSRRKERKQREDAARAQVKLERRAQKQRQESDEAIQLLANYPPIPAGPRKEVPSAAGEAAAAVVERVLHRGETPSEAVQGSVTALPTSSDSVAQSGGPRTPPSWPQSGSQEDIASGAPKKDMKVDTSPQADLRSFTDSRYNSSRPSPESEYPEETLIQTATAVRLSVCSMSPPPSPAVVRSPTLVHHTPSHSRKVSREITKSEKEQLKNSQGEALASAWTSFFKKATTARLQKEHDETEASSSVYQSPPSEGNHTDSPANTIRASRSQHLSSNPDTFSNSPDRISGNSKANSTTYLNSLPSTGPIPRSRLSLSTFGLPSPRLSEVPGRLNDEELLGEHPSPLPTLGLSPLSPTMSRTSKISSSSPVRVNASISAISARPESPERFSPSSKHFSGLSYYGGPGSSRSSLVNERASGVSRSMASLESEGSWLSGRLTTKRSGSGISPIRDSATSLRHRYRDIEGHEDRRASIADDEYFSGVPPGEDFASSDEEEKAILASYADEEATEEVAAISPVPLRPTSSVRSLDKGNFRSSREILEEPGTWREGLGRRPTITRIDSGRVKSREGLLNFYDDKSERSDSVGAIRTSYILRQPMEGELVDNDTDSFDRRRDSPSPTLGRDSPRFVTPSEYITSDPFSTATDQNTYS